MLMNSLGGNLTGPLLRLTRPMPGEHILSFLQRLAALNGYEPPSLLYGLILDGAIQDRTTSSSFNVADGTGCSNSSTPNWVRYLDRPVLPSIYNSLARLTCLTPVELYFMTPHRFAPIFWPSRIQANDEKIILTPTRSDIVLSENNDLWGVGRTLSNGAIDTNGTDIVNAADDAQRVILPLMRNGPTVGHLRLYEVTQFCPLCLASGPYPYGRLLWRVRALAVCLEHQCILLCACPGCGASVSISEVTSARCRRCNSSLAEVDPVALHYITDDDEGFLAQKVLAEWLMKGGTNVDAGFTTSTYEILFANSARLAEGAASLDDQQSALEPRYAPYPYLRPYLRSYSYPYSTPSERQRWVPEYSSPTGPPASYLQAPNTPTIPGVDDYNLDTLQSPMPVSALVGSFYRRIWLESYYPNGQLRTKLSWENIRGRCHYNEKQESFYTGLLTLQDPTNILGAESAIRQRRSRCSDNDKPTKKSNKCSTTPTPAQSYALYGTAFRTLLRISPDFSWYIWNLQVSAYEASMAAKVDRVE
jgi:hypothetical protein